MYDEPWLLVATNYLTWPYLIVGHEIADIGSLLSLPWTRGWSTGCGIISGDVIISILE